MVRFFEFDIKRNIVVVFVMVLSLATADCSLLTVASMVLFFSLTLLFCLRFEWFLL